MIVFVLVGCFGGFVLSATAGCGGVMIMLPLLALVLPPSAAIALATPVMLAYSATALVVMHRKLDFAYLRMTLLGALPAAALGALLVGFAPDIWLRRIIGLFALGYVGYQLLRSAGYAPQPKRKRRSPHRLVGWGALTGLCGGLVGAGGIPNAASMNEIGLTRQEFASTAAALSISLQVVKLPIFVAGGVLRSVDLPLGLGLVVVAVGGALTGRALLEQLSDRFLRNLMLAALCALGVAML